MLCLWSYNVMLLRKGCSKPYFFNKGISMNQYNYLKECIQKKVIPFVRQ